MSDYTPGPWDFVWAVDGKAIVSSSTKHIAEVGDIGDENDVEKEANAHLIAAAPEMYDALYWLLHLASGVSKGGPDHPITEREWAEAVEAGKDAIAKAKGREA